MSDEPIEFFVFGIPRPAGSKTIARFKGKQWLRPDCRGQKPWQKHVSFYARRQVRDALLGPLELTCIFVLPRPKEHYRSHHRHADKVKAVAPILSSRQPDTTKLLRAVEDACNGILWIDDRQIAWQTAIKIYGHVPGVFIRVRKLAATPGGDQRRRADDLLVHRLSYRTTGDCDDADAVGDAREDAGFPQAPSERSRRGKAHRDRRK